MIVVNVVDGGGGGGGPGGGAGGGQKVILLTRTFWIAFKKNEIEKPGGYRRFIEMFW